MADMTGMELIGQARELCHENYLPVIIFSQEPDLEERIKSMALDIEDYIAKPYYPEEAAVRIHAALQERKRWGARSDLAEAILSGRLETINLLDLVRMAAVGEKTGLLVLTTSKQQGSVSFSQARSGCAAGHITGKPALMQLMLWTAGEFCFRQQPDAGQERTISADSQALCRWLEELSLAHHSLLGRITSLDSIVVASQTALAAPGLERNGTRLAAASDHAVLHNLPAATT